MRAVVTRVSSASVAIEGETVGKIGKGFLVLLGVGPEDTEALADKMADKICGLRVFSDEAGKMNLNLAAAGGELLVVSQIPLYEKFMACCRDRGFHVEHGAFGADMAVSSVNDGPVTLCIEL